MSLRRARWASVLVFGALAATLACAEPSDEAAAIDTATGWLSLIDSGSYSESWDQAAPPLQSAVAKEEWEQTMADLRNSFGKMNSRTLKTAEARTSLPGAPEGRYVVVQFETSFENQASVTETVTPMYENGKWKVSGYFIE